VELLPLGGLWGTRTWPSAKNRRSTTSALRESPSNTNQRSKGVKRITGGGRAPGLPPSSGVEKKGNAGGQRLTKPACGQGVDKQVKKHDSTQKKKKKTGQEKKKEKGTLKKKKKKNKKKKKKTKKKQKNGREHVEKKRGGGWLIRLQPERKQSVPPPDKSGRPDRGGGDAPAGKPVMGGGVRGTGGGGQKKGQASRDLTPGPAA